MEWSLRMWCLSLVKKEKSVYAISSECDPGIAIVVDGHWFSKPPLEPWQNFISSDWSHNSEPHQTYKQSIHPPYLLSTPDSTPKQSIELSPSCPPLRNHGSQADPPSALRNKKVPLSKQLEGQQLTIFLDTSTVHALRPSPQKP